MIKFYIILYLDLFIKGILFLLFGMKTWSIYTCNKDYFEKKYNHVKNFGDVFKEDWPKIDKLSVCDDDTDLEGLGFIKRGFIYSINWSDYWTKRWICFFLNFGLESFCCDDPKQNCQGDTEFITKELPDSLPKHTDTILLGVISFFKIIGYGGLNLLYLFILFPVCLSAGFSGSYQSKDDYENLCKQLLKKAIEELPDDPLPFSPFSNTTKWFWGTFGRFGIWMSKWGFFFASWAMLCAFNYVRVLFFMLSGEECGCNLFTKWEKQSNKLILIRMAVPFLIWASLMFSLFMFFQISMLRGITSPQIMPPYIFKETLELYFMKHNILTLKKQNMKPKELIGFYEYASKENRDFQNRSGIPDTSGVTDAKYDTDGTFFDRENRSFEENLKYLEVHEVMNDENTSYDLNRLPQILAALQIDLYSKKGLVELDKRFKNNQTVLSNALNEIYGEDLNSVYKELYKWRHIHGDRKENRFNWFSGWAEIIEPDSKEEISMEIINKYYEYKKYKDTQNPNDGDPDSLKTKNYNDTLVEKKKEFKTLIEHSENPSGKTNLKTFYCMDYVNGDLKCSHKDAEKKEPVSTPPKGSASDGSIAQLFTKMYELCAEFAAMPFRILDKILASPLMDLPFLMIDVLFSDKIMDLIFGIPQILIEIPIALLKIPILVVKIPIVILKWIATWGD